MQNLSIQTKTTNYSGNCPSGYERGWDSAQQAWMLADTGHLRLSGEQQSPAGIRGVD